MVTLISHKLPGGRRRSCSARCYNAKGFNCRCICHGLNHGVGLTKAVENTSRRTELLKEFEGVQLQSPLPLT